MARPQFVSDDIGSIDDTISVLLNGDRIVVAESWECHESVLSQPGTWAIRTGWGGVAADLLKKYPKGTPFELRVGSITQATGRTDAPGASQPPDGATTVSFRGRDALAPIHDTYVRAAVGVDVSTYPDLCWYALQQVGLAPKGQGIDPSILQVDNVANRQLKAGVPIRSILPHRTVEQILDDAGLGGPNAGVVHTVPQAKIGESWHRFLRRYLDRAGLMFWAAADGSFVLGAPNGNQPPTYTLVRRTGERNLGANVVGYDFEDDATHRHSEVDVYGRGGGRKLGPVKSKGSFADQEMVDAGYPNQVLVVRDANVHSVAEASYLARRKIAEERRAGWRLEYTVAGLTLPFAGTSGADRAVITVDTVVEVHDDELGLDDNFYIEAVTRRRSPQTTTTMRLMRIDDLVFGGPDADSES